MTTILLLLAGVLALFAAARSSSSTRGWFTLAFVLGVIATLFAVYAVWDGVTIDGRLIGNSARWRFAQAVLPLASVVVAAIVVWLTVGAARMPQVSGMLIPEES